MTTNAGDRIVVESEKAGQPGRSGIVEQVLAERPMRLRVRWDDGRTSIISPASGAARLTSRKR